jgi:hypothetical protein
MIAMIFIHRISIDLYVCVCVLLELFSLGHRLARQCPENPVSCAMNDEFNDH